MSVNKHIIVILLLLFCSGLAAQNVTGVEGVVIDAENEETLPAVEVYFVGTTIGTITDLDGNFKLENTSGLITVSFKMLGYKTQILSLRPNHIMKDVKIKLEPDVYNLNEITIKPPKRTKENKYRRKNNPAVELINNVIAHKGEGRIGAEENYKVNSYEKLTMALDRFDVDFDSSKFWSQFKFIEKYIDTSQFNTTPTLIMSLRETLSEDYFNGQTKKEKRYIKAKRFQGVEEILEKEGLSSNIDAMFTKVNIFDNDIEIMLNRFVSPLSSSLAVSYYHYYIMDTIEIDGSQCIDLAFAPVNTQSYGFTGHLYIVNDSTYALKKYSIKTPPHINMNFVSDLAIEQTFTKNDEGLWINGKTNTFVKFYLFKKMRQVYAHHMLYQYGFESGVQTTDSLSTSTDGNVIEAENARKFGKAEWNSMRPEELSGKEVFIDSLLPELRRIPKFNATISAVEILASGYVATNKSRSKSKFDFGPIYNTISYNSLEGIRIRLGGMSTTNLAEKWFMNGYIAFGCRDLRFKHNAMLIYSFNKKDYHPFESLRHALYLSTYYDVEIPGQTFSLLDRDNIFMSLSIGSPTTRMQYVRRTKLRYEKEWANRFSIDMWFQHENNEAAGSMRYERINADGSLTPIKYYNNIEYGLQLRFAPGEPIYNNRLGKESPFNLSKDAPVIRLTHRIGLMEYKYIYNCTEISAEKRFWLSSFGHIDAILQTGIVWNKVPYPKLYMPNSNQSLFMTPNSFSLMEPMEFIMDQYAVFFATYYMKGWIFNRIPLIKKLRLREVASFGMVYGGLSQKNNPLLLHEGLYAMPQGASPIGKVPYMEMSVGIENIFKFIRIDYVRRLSYVQGLSGWKKNGIRFTFRLTI